MIKLTLKEKINNNIFYSTCSIVIHTSICPDRCRLKQLDFLLVKESWKISPEQSGRKKVNFYIYCLNSMAYIRNSLGTSP